MRRKAKALEKRAQSGVSESVVAELSQEREQEKTTEEKDLSILSETEKTVYLALCEENTTADILGKKTSLPSDTVLSALTMLEIYGLITSLPGGMYEAV